MRVLELDTLPVPQQIVFEQLTFTRDRFVLYGGTAVALLAGHRISLDFDFFGSDPLTETGKQSILRSLSLDLDFPRIQDTENTLSIRVPTQHENNGDVMLSFFGNRDKPCFGMPCAALSGPRIAAPVDLAGFKLAMAHQRNKEDDLIDLAALLSLGETMSRAAFVMDSLYPRQLSLHHAVASAAWFEDRESSVTGTLTTEIKQQLETAVAGYRGPSTSLSRQAALLSAPGYDPARVRGNAVTDKESRNRIPGS